MIFIVIALGFVAVLAKIVYIQAVERDEWLKVAEKQVPTNRPIPATRGNILDCNGRLLASSMPQYYIYMDTRVPALHEKKGELFNKHIDTLALDLATIIGDKSPAEYKAKIVGAYRRGEKRLRVCENRINYLQRQALEQNKLIKKGKYKSGIFFEDQHRRIKPYGLLASRTIGGIYGEDGVGNSGLEKRFLENLNAKEEQEKKERPVASSVKEKMSRYDIRTETVEISPDFTYIGKTLKEMPFRKSSGVNIIKIQRGSRSIEIPSGEEPVFPYDKLVAVGTPAQLEAFESILHENVRQYVEGSDGSGFDVVKIVLKEDSFLTGKTLREADMRKGGCTVISILHNDKIIANPGADFRLSEGDTIWIAGNEKSCQWYK